MLALKATGFVGQSPSYSITLGLKYTPPNNISIFYILKAKVKADSLLKASQL